MDSEKAFVKWRNETRANALDWRIAVRARVKWASDYLANARWCASQRNYFARFRRPSFRDVPLEDMYP